MATFSDLTSDVMTITNRPDLIAETKLAVKAATLKIHQSDYYYKDLFETGLSWDTAAYTQEVDLSLLFSYLELLNMFVVMIPLVQEKQKSFIPY